MPKARLQQFSVEAWASVRGGKGEVRVIVSTGRYALLVTKQNLWGMSMYDPKYGVTILVTGPAYVEGKWTHIAGTFDGTMIRLYVEGKLEGEEDMDERSRHLAHAEEKTRVHAELDRRAEEKREREEARLVIEKRADEYFSTKGGKVELNTKVKKLVSKSKMRIKMNPEKAAALGWTVMLPAEARNHTINEWVVKEEEKYQELISERHRKIIADRKATRERNATLAVGSLHGTTANKWQGSVKKAPKGQAFLRWGYSTCCCIYIPAYPVNYYSSCHCWHT